MARARNIKPGFFANEELVELPFSTRLLFIGLWTIADRAGRLEDRPKRIKMAIFPADNVDCDEALNELQASGFLLRYAVGEERYIQILAFDKHQNPHRDEKQSTIPAPCEHGANTVQTAKKQDANPADSLIPDSLIPDSGFHDTAAKAAPAAPKYDPKADLLESGVESQTAADWLALRKAKKAPVTKTALDAIKREVEKAGMQLGSALVLCCERGWAGFKAEWVQQPRASPVATKPEKFDPLAYVNRTRNQPNERTIEINEHGEPV